MIDFLQVQPTLANYWRAIILFGQNQASYKFALGKSLLELAQAGMTFVPLTELAVPYARHVSEHLKLVDKQGVKPTSAFLNICRKYNRNEATLEQLVAETVRSGFRNVIDAFHVVNKEDLEVRFFIDERTGGSQEGIRLTDDVLRLPEECQHRNLPHEIEARWRLVETAWELELPVHALAVAYDEGAELLVAESRLLQRKPITSCRNALNGYQKGKCFYCFGNISLVSGAADLGAVDHFFPHTLKQFSLPCNLDGVWNLVLACQGCNGSAGKSARVPEAYLPRLHRRNEFLIESHHPLRETLILQTGKTEQARRAFLNEANRRAVQLLIQKWKAPYEFEPAF